jgi:CubicO group peptidase (beta-lactamase class C family)
MKTVLLITLITIAAFLPAIGQTDIDALDRYIESARSDWNIPGMSVVVVKDGKVVLSKGYGVRELGKADPVDTKTLFGAMSTTKAMTAVAMGLLVDEGKVSWRDKVVKHLPDFRIGIRTSHRSSRSEIFSLTTPDSGAPTFYGHARLSSPLTKPSAGCSMRNLLTRSEVDSSITTACTSSPER